MSNLFDDIQGSAFKVVTNTMGYDATWTPTAGGPEQTARVLFKDPTERAEMLNVDYDPGISMMEYYVGSFENLKPAVDAKNDEIVTINGDQYGVQTARKKYDGKTFYAELIAI